MKFKLYDIPPIIDYKHVQVVLGNEIGEGGGIKKPILDQVLANIEADIIGYPADGKGSAGEALALACKTVGKRLHLLLPEGELPETETFRKSVQPDHVTYETVAGVQRQADLVPAAEAWAKKNSGFSMEIGCRIPEFNQGLQDYITAIWKHHNLKTDAEIWYAAGSGTLFQAIKKALPESTLGIGSLGFSQMDVGGHMVKSPFNATIPTHYKLPFSVNPDYDARIWPEVLKRASPGAVVINYQ